MTKRETIEAELAMLIYECDCTSSRTSALRVARAIIEKYDLKRKQQPEADAASFVSRASTR